MFVHSCHSCRCSYIKVRITNDVWVTFYQRHRLINDVLKIYIKVGSRKYPLECQWYNIKEHTVWAIRALKVLQVTVVAHILYDPYQDLTRTFKKKNILRLHDFNQRLAGRGVYSGYTVKFEFVRGFKLHNLGTSFDCLTLSTLIIHESLLFCHPLYSMN